MKNLLKVLLSAAACAALPLGALFGETFVSDSPRPIDLSKFRQGGIYENLITNFGIPYKTADDEILRFDISYPKGPVPEGGFPLAVYIHGGAWVGGERFSGYGYFNDEIRHYNSKGIAVASVTYRFARGSNPARGMDVCVADCMDALRFMTKHARTLMINPKKIGVYGHSAGGHLAFMVALADQSLFPGDPSLEGVKYEIACAVPQSGPVAFTRIQPVNPGLYKVLFGGRGDAFKEMLSPLNYMGKKCPPMLILQGDRDDLVPVEGAREIYEKGRAAGAPVELVVSENARHSFEDAKNPDNDRLADIRRAFFVRHLAGE